MPILAPIRRDVAITMGGAHPEAVLDGALEAPEGAVGLVLFAHGSGSSRHSPRNRYVAEVFQQAKLATLLFDLLTHEEGERDAIDRGLRFDIDLLAARVIGAIDWVTGQHPLERVPIGLFGASTGAAAALVAAAARPKQIAAVVSRGGRPDLAGEALIAVRAPTLLLVGSRDAQVIQLNQLASRHMRAPVELLLVPGATHLFEEPGALEVVAQRAAEFFHDQLTQPIPNGELG